jgi:hypothetical protein
MCFIVEDVRVVQLGRDSRRGIHSLSKSIDRAWLDDTEGVETFSLLLIDGRIAAINGRGLGTSGAPGEAKNDPEKQDKHHSAEDGDDDVGVGRA